MKRLLLFGILAAMVVGTLQAGRPSTQINYQGVLRDASDHPLDGTYGMVFRFFSADAGGDEILVDTHGAVTVSNGLFGVKLGGIVGVAEGVVTDGSGPGNYTYLPAVFADYTDVYLEVEVNGEVLSPRTRILSAPSAMNARYVNGVNVADGPLDLYVDAVTGDDGNSGLFPSAPKRTIQAAIDRVPAILTGPITVHIADGTYNEEVFIGNLVLKEPYPVVLQGNETSPENVVLDGQDMLEEGIHVLGVAVIRGMTVTGFLDSGIEFGHGFTVVENCRVLDNYVGFEIGLTAGEITDTFVSLNVEGMAVNGSEELIISGTGSDRCRVYDNTVGIVAKQASRIFISGCEINNNATDGIAIRSGSHVDAQADGGLAVEISANAGFGVSAADNSCMDFNGLADLSMQSNGVGAMQASYHSTIRGYGNGSIQASGCTLVDAHSMCDP